MYPEELRTYSMYPEELSTYSEELRTWHVSRREELRPEEKNLELIGFIQKNFARIQKNLELGMHPEEFRIYSMHPEELSTY